ncbi:hypothetical protein KGQ29_01290 [Patescibacteria group bacterium]|nr:hypothetical protein [Patescibacteria group bacterium]
MTQNDKNYDSVDLSGMLKNSRPTVEFEEYGISRSYRDSSADTPKIIRLVIRYSGGLIKDGKQASFVLLGFVAVAIVISLVLLSGGATGNKIKSPSKDIINRPQSNL